MKRLNILSAKKPKSVDEVVDILFELRGVKTEKEKEEFLNPDMKSISMKAVGIKDADLKKTISRILTAIERNEKIIIYGDYDVDGITGTAILWETLFETYKNVLPYIPSRVDEGYGISIKGIDNLLAKEGDIKLIITVDNGIVANEAVDYASEKGIDVIITDHHAKSEVLPSAFSIVHTTNLCGAGVAYLLSKEIKKKLKVEDDGDNHLELAALATVADLVPLNNFNRVIVKFGLLALRKTNRLGLISLFEEARIKNEEIDTYHIGFIIGPRINATGRIGHGIDSLRLLCTKDKTRARLLAQKISEANKNRQIITSESADHAALKTVEIDKTQKFIVVSGTSYNEGVIGLIASRLVEKHYRPVVVIAEGEINSKGSARSIVGFNMIEFLRKHDHMLINVGGHPMAAGFTIATERILEFKNTLIENSSEFISDELLDRKIDVDMEIDSGLIGLDLYNHMKNFKPFGMGNPEPLFLSQNLHVKNIRRFGKENNHIELLLELRHGNEMKGILFNAREIELKIDDLINVVYNINQDNWNGNKKLQMRIVDIKVN